MKINELKKECRKLAQDHGLATVTGDFKAVNRNHDKLVALVPMIKSFGDAGKTMLLELTGDTDEAVVCWSATYALFFDETRAVAVLEPLSKKQGPIGFTAKMVLQQWNKGKLVLP